MIDDSVLVQPVPLGAGQTLSSPASALGDTSDFSLAQAFSSQPPVAQVSQPAAKQDVAGGLKQIGVLAETVSVHFKQAVREIERINLQTKVLSLNAQIESARAGVVGNAFGVVATAMVHLSAQTTEVTTRLATETQASINTLNQLIASLGVDIRGTRLSDLAMTNIDVIDRNLYERSCDVRWWATDNSVVDALTHDSKEARDHACQRLGVILDSYTVYYDIVLCDLQGRVVANGRHSKYQCMGSSQWDAEWFQTALKTRSGTEFGFQSVHSSPSLAGREHILVYSCGVRENGDAQGRLVGVLGIIFNWRALGQTIVCGTFISQAEKASTRVCIVNDRGLVLADSANKIVAETLSLPDQRELFATKKQHITAEYQGERCLIAHALSPGFETYATGWHSLIIQKLNQR